MADDAGRDLLVRGIAAAKAKSVDEARFFLEKCLRQRPSLETRVQAWRYLAEIATTPSEQRDYLGRILAFDPTDGLARRALAILDGRLDPADVINPEQVAVQGGSPGAVSGNVPAQRLTCPSCGSGRLAASADGSALVCGHCQFTQPIAAGDGTVDDHDFAATMWTAKGHRREERVLTWSCNSCGAGFLMTPGLQSFTCPFCASVHLSPATTPHELIPAEAIVPFGASQQTADAALRSALGAARFSNPIAAYLPVWSLTFAGTATWRGYEREDEGFDRHAVEVSGDFTVLDHPAMVAATSLLPDAPIDNFDLTAMVPYDARQLAGIPAATYDITLDKASVAARRKAIATLRESIAEDVRSSRVVYDLTMQFARLGIDRFKLLLLPFWLSQITHESERRLIFVNGQSGALGEAARTGGLMSWLTGLFGSDS